MTPRLIIQQKITAFANRYAIYTANSEGSKNQLVAFAQQKRLAFKEKVDFYDDEKKTNHIFSFRAEKVMDIHGRFLVEDSNGELIGAFRKVFGESLVNSTWEIFDQQQNLKFKVTESNMALAVLRRFADFIPIVGELFSLVLMFFRYHFVFKDVTNGQATGRYEKTKLFLDHYKLEMDDEAYSACDWRVFAAFSVALDALQGR